MVKGFQIAWNLAGPIGDLTGKQPGKQSSGKQSSGKAAKKDLAILEFSSWAERVSLESTLHYRR